jgi:C_GCAxxG_C_C family probable redox protein
MVQSNFPKASPDLALKAFNSGYNCAQSVVKVFAEALGFDENEAVSKAAGLGGGGFQGICGAVSGAYLVLEVFCSLGMGDKGHKLCFETLQENFRKQFQQMHGTDQCKVLLRNEAIQPKNSAQSICERCIVDAVEIINGILR